MSKKIDFSKPLSAEDAAYAADRPWLAEDARLQGLDVIVSDDFEVEDDEDDESDETDESTEGDDSEEDDEDEEESDEDEEPSDDYSEWNVDRLKAELKDRGLTVGGSKEQLIERLEASDE